MSLSCLPNEIISQIILSIASTRWPPPALDESNIDQLELDDVDPTDAGRDNTLSNDGQSDYSYRQSDNGSALSNLDAQRSPSLTHTLWALSACSYRLHGLTEPFLYASFTEMGETSLLLFLRTILECPRLALLVTSYEGRDTRTYTVETTLSFPWVEQTFHQQEEDDKLKQILLLAIQRGEINDDGSLLWIKDIVDGSWDATTALAILCLPNLHTLSLKLINLSFLGPRGGVMGEAFDAMAFRWINRSLRDAQELQASGDTLSEYSMGKLETIRLGYSLDDERWIYVSNILGFLRLNTLKTFEADGLWLRYDVDRTVSFSVPKILIKNCPCLDRTATALKVFQDVETLDITIVPGLNFPVSCLISKISHMRDSLRELTIKCREDDTPIRASDYTPSLCEFEVLERLDIMSSHLSECKEPNVTPTAQANIVSWDAAMPGSLKTLVIRSCVQSTVREASNFVSLKAARQSKLEALHLEFLHESLSEVVQKDVATLSEQCSKAGVMLTVDWDGH